MKCLHCQTEFTPRRSTAAFCSTRCRVAYHRTGEQRPRPEKLYSITGLTKGQHKWLMDALKSHAEHVKHQEAKARWKADDEARKNAKHSDFVAKFGAAYTFMADDQGNAKPGIYWFSQSGKATAIEVCKGSRGGIFVMVDGKKHKPKFDWFGGWSVAGIKLYGAERECQDHCDRTTEDVKRAFERAGIFIDDKPSVSHLSDEDLKRLRSKNHPDRNANADVTAYQAACEELDRRRA